MSNVGGRSAARRKRHTRIRLRISGTVERPRLAVYRSIDQIYAQVIDDRAGHTLAAASSLEKELRAGDRRTKTQLAGEVGRLIAQRARAAGVSRVVFDRAGFRYHGRIRSLAEAAREAGLEF
ncbi:MAG: 50S ribosomal protein L18 [Chloroflexi bacterium GWC2_73_18]|nr:MAG: 50S ribosomal protein L18 [Chloroflexi bacterium GWC2_73_18]